jgi:alkylation response protein AidB-like acyl-CoA dehydrogenase
MIHIAGKASKEDSQILHAAIGLGSQIRAASEEIEEGRRIPPPLAAAMKEAGVFGMVMPRAWGGPELDPTRQFRVIEALAMMDGSVGWCAMIGCDAGYSVPFSIRMSLAQCFRIYFLQWEPRRPRPEPQL